MGVRVNGLLRPGGRTAALLGVVGGLACLSLPGLVQAQTSPPATAVLRAKELVRARDRLAAGDTALVPALDRLTREADAALQMGPVSVMDKSRPPPSGDRHDYMSFGPYWWPDPSKPGGMPYIRKDGQRNPDAARDSDSPRQARMMEAVETLALAYWFTGKEPYAEHAARLLRTWYVDSATRMKANLEFGQAIPGRTPGRGSGIIDTHRLPVMLDAVRLLEASHAWTGEDGAGLRRWMTEYLHWLRESRNGREERAAANNHGSWYDAQVTALALFVGDTVAARDAALEGRSRIGKITADGRQPLELARTRSLNYSAFNLDALTTLAELATHVGVDLWHYRAPSGGSIGVALRYVAPYADLTRPWPGRQITRQAPDYLLVQLLRGKAALGDVAFDSALAALPAGLRRTHRATLLYPSS